eukprot:gene3566-14721_t
MCVAAMLGDQLPDGKCVGDGATTYPRASRWKKFAAEHWHDPDHPLSELLHVINKMPFFTLVKTLNKLDGIITGKESWAKFFTEWSYKRRGGADRGLIASV